MKLNSFAINFQSNIGGKPSLKFKSFSGMKQARKLKSFLMVFGILLLVNIAHSQNIESSNLIESNETTTLLLKELERKVSLTKSLEVELNNENLSPVKKEEILSKLYSSKKDIMVYVAHSLEERCTKENRLLEISIIVKPLDAKLSEKFEILHKENQSTNR